MYCKKCGDVIDDDSVFCKTCGSRQQSGGANTCEAETETENTSPESTTDTKKNKNNISKLISIVLAVVIVVCVSVSVLSRKSPGEAYLCINPGMTHKQVKRLMRFYEVAYESPSEAGYMTSDFFGYDVSVYVNYNDDGEVRWARATLECTGDSNDAYEKYEVLLSNCIKELGEPTTFLSYIEEGEDWLISTYDYSKHVILEISSDFDEIVLRTNG